MRLTIVITIMTVLQLQATTSVGQRITYKKNSVTLIELFKEIQAQTGYNVTWDETKIDISSKINVNFKDVSLKDALTFSLKDLPVAYEIITEDRSVSIKYEAPSFFDKIVAKLTAIDVRGVVLDEKGLRLNGATVKVKGTNRSVSTNDKGEFYLRGIDDNAVLVVTHLGYVSQEVKASANVGFILLIPSEDALNEVEIVNTGYEFVPKERATGSFTFIDNKTIDRAVAPDILSKLNGVANGLLYRKSGDLPATISIRGRSTIFANKSVLIVVNNFPFDGDIASLNPNDIESVTLLKDAAAAAIWGTRAGNGVLVITTKKGVYNQAPKITVNSSLTFSDKPDLYYAKQLSSSEFIDVEKFLFEKGRYTSNINSPHTAISPVVEILQRQKIGQLDATQANVLIDNYRNYDIRDQLSKYYYRKGVDQQYSFNMAGGGGAQNYFLSGGYDKSLSSLIGKSNDRFTLKANNSYKALKDKLIINADLSFSVSKNANDVAPYTPFLPYDRIADEKGNALPVYRNLNSLRESFTDTVGKGRLLNWKYKPLDELRNGYDKTNRNSIDYRLNLGLNYKLLNPLSFSLNYQFYKVSGLFEDYKNVESFYTRDVINRPSYIEKSTGVLVRPIPLGGILLSQNSSGVSNALRGQLNFNKTLNRHEIIALAGYELREFESNYKTNALYGFIPDRASSKPVDQTATYTNFFVPGTTNVERPVNGFQLDRNVSYYINSSYSYKNKYVMSASFRKDASNLFGVKANQKGVPLWSSGLLWHVHKESFLKVNWLERMTIRGTFGYNGNVSKDVTAYLTAEDLGTLNTYRQNYAAIQNPPNDNLRWERVKNINVGIDFSVLNHRLSGSLEMFLKDGMDLIGTSPIAPQSGIEFFTGNTANTRTKGFDVQLNSINIDSKFKWSTTYILNHATEKITAYQSFVGTNADIIGASITPLKGYPIDAVFAYKWRGLDAGGSPQGFVNGTISKDYTSIRNSTNIDDLDFFGSSVPTLYGSLRNTISYKIVEFSFNLTYKLGYFVERTLLSYSALYNNNYVQSGYDKRWKSPGDEHITDTPGMNYPLNSSGAGVYVNSSLRVEKGNHLRLQDIQLSCNLTEGQIEKLPVSNVKIYVYMTNIGLLWKSTNDLKDPEIRSGYPNPLSLAFGLKTNF